MRSEGTDGTSSRRCPRPRIVLRRGLLEVRRDCSSFDDCSRFDDRSRFDAGCSSPLGDAWIAEEGHHDAESPTVERLRDGRRSDDQRSPGTGVGLAAALLLTATTSDDSNTRELLGFSLFLVPIGGGIGAGIDKLHDTRELVFRRDSGRGARWDAVPSKPVRWTLSLTVSW